MDQPIFRFAPSPNGELHLGHAYSALLNLKLARQSGGKILLRIEDIDIIRCTPELETQMLHDLEWLGFEWDEPPRRQSKHFDEYRAALEILEGKDLLFPSNLSRSEIKKLVMAKTNWPKDPDGGPHYPGDEHHLSIEEQEAITNSAKPYSLRFDVEKSKPPSNLTWQEQTEGTIPANPIEWGKPIIARKDSPASYHLCCVVDDALQGITNIIRGRDLYHATSLHRLLQTLLKLPEPHYHHHALVIDDDGRKLSKSRQDTSIAELRKAGLKPSDIREILTERGLDLS